MSLIGDMIISARELYPDMPATLPAPTAAAAVVASASSTLPTGTYACIVTQRNAWGETLGATEVTGLVVGAAQGVQVTSALLPGATTIRAYITVAGGAAGSETGWIESTASPFVISAPPTSFGTPPSRSTAWLPDTDGKFVSAFTVYRWLNHGLSRLARRVGGLQDYTAVGSVVGQPLYALNGDWSKIQSIWYDGFALTLGNQRDFFRRNVIQSSVLASAGVSIRTNQVVIEIFYQPVRTAGSTTLANAMLVSDTTAVLAAAPFQIFAPPMFAQLGSGANAEIIAYSQLSGVSLLNLIRGVGGTTPQAWPIGTAVTELNIPVLGKRLSTQNYLPGNGYNTLPVPLGWESILPTFMLHKMRNAEQEYTEAKALLDEFDAACDGFLRSIRQLAGPQQVKQSPAIETVPGFGSSLGGVVLP